MGLSCVTPIWTVCCELRSFLGTPFTHPMRTPSYSSSFVLPPKGRLAESSHWVGEPTITEMFVLETISSKNKPIGHPKRATDACNDGGTPKCVGPPYLRTFMPDPRTGI